MPTLARAKMLAMMVNFMLMTGVALMIGDRIDAWKAE